MDLGEADPVVAIYDLPLETHVSTLDIQKCFSCSGGLSVRSEFPHVFSEFFYEDFWIAWHVFVGEKFSRNT